MPAGDRIWIETYLKETLPKEVSSGRKHLLGGEKGRKARGMLDDKQAMDMCLRIHKEHPDLKLGEIREKARQKLGFSFSCVEQHTPGLKQKIAELKK